ncbi:MAG: TraR/DksA C4-type zinc finger protein [Bacteroidetes bacterium]|nr:TraR/DksA C4-type zinc finger protein [Bacteroidota bacterium]
MATIKNLVKFAAKFLDMAKSKSKDKKKAVKAKSAKPAAKAKIKPVAKKASKPAKKVATKVKKTAKPVKKAKPVVKKVANVKAVKAKPVKAKVAKGKPVAKKKAVAKNKVIVVKKVDKKKAKVKQVEKKEVKAIKPVKKEVVAKAPKTVEPVVKVKGKRGRPAKPVEKKFVRQAIKPEVKTFYNTLPQLKPQQPTKVSRQPNIPVKTNLRYSDKELKEFKILIDKKLLTAREELAYLKDALDNHTDSQAGSKAWNMEEGTDTSEMETLMNQISRQHGYIRNLELALVRIENRTYGICRVSGKLIPKERLRVVPHATLSLESKMTRRTDEDTTATSAAPAPPSDFGEGFED